MPFPKIFSYFNCLYIAGKRFYCEKYGYRTSALAFTTVLAIIPLLLVTSFFLSLLPYFEELTVSAKKYLLTNFVPEATARTVQQYLAMFIDQAQALPVLSFAFLFITVVMMALTIDETINDIWKSRQRDMTIQNLTISFLIILVLPLILGLTVFLSQLLLEEIHSAGIFKRGLVIIIPILINAFFFTLLYGFVPNARVKLGYAILGALFTAILLEITKYGFSLYLTQSSSYGLIYGALATIPIFLVWLYLCWLIILFGGLFTHSLSKHCQAS